MPRKVSANVYSSQGSCWEKMTLESAFYSVSDQYNRIYLMNWYVHDKGLQAAENLKSYNGSGIVTEKGRSMDKKAERAKIKLSELKQNNNTFHI